MMHSMRAPSAQGAVVRAEIAADREGGAKGYGTVEMGSTRDAAKAIQLLNGHDFNGHSLDVRPDAFA
jgi:RNA recognition motif-containing protein